MKEDNVFKDFIYLFFLEGREGEREGDTNIDVREKHNWLPLAHPQLGTWPATPACALTRIGTSDLSVHRWILNPQSHTSQDNVFISR